MRIAAKSRDIRVMKKSTTSSLGSKRDPPSDRKHGKGSTARFSVRELGSTTWPDFERVVEKHNGIWGGCWCVAFHLKRSEEKEWTGKHRALKEKLVRANQYSSSFLWGGTEAMFAKLGFRPLGALGTSKWMMRKVVPNRTS